jgi:SAM-dependent methyltransferase
MNALLRPLAAAFRTARKFTLRGKGYYCSLCDVEYRHFLPAGLIPRENAVCPVCGSYERHRLLWIALDTLNLRRHGGRLLHVAPEACLANQLRKSFDYVSIDLDGARAMHAMDVTSLRFPDEAFDFVICNHVLEHVPADHQALAELFRVMKRGAYGSIQVPMKGDITEEDLTITDPGKREASYGQADHVRQYGNDFKERLRATGFEVIDMKKEDLADPDKLFRLSVNCESGVLLVRRPADARSPAVA